MPVIYRSRARIVAAAALLLALAPVCCSSCGGFPSGTTSKLEKIVAEELARTGAPGAVVGIWTPEGNWIAAEGNADEIDGRHISTGEAYRVGTDTMAFVATVGLNLVDEKTMGLDDKLAKYVPGIPNGDSIDVRMLMNHTSGIFDYTEDETWRSRLAADPERRWSPRELVDVALEHQPYFQPGAGWHFSSTNYILLGMVIEKAGGVRLSYQIKQRCVDRLGLSTTYLADGTEIEGAHFNGYWTNPGTGRFEDITRLNASCAWAAGAIVSNLEEMREWAESNASGTLYSGDMQKNRQEWVETGRKMGGLPLQYGLGIAKAGDLLGQSGEIYGYQGAAYYIPEKKATIVVCLNAFPTTSGTADDLVAELLEVIYPDLFP